MYPRKNRQLFWLALLAMVMSLPATASAQLVNYAQNAVTFAPAVLVQPIITAIIAAVGAAVALWVIWTGLKWVFKVLGVKR